MASLRSIMGMKGLYEGDSSIAKIGIRKWRQPEWLMRESCEVLRVNFDGSRVVDRREEC